MSKFLTKVGLICNPGVGLRKQRVLSASSCFSFLSVFCVLCLCLCFSFSVLPVFFFSLMDGQRQQFPPAPPHHHPSPMGGGPRPSSASFAPSPTLSGQKRPFHHRSSGMSLFFVLLGVFLLTLICYLKLPLFYFSF